MSKKCKEASKQENGNDKNLKTISSYFDNIGNGKSKINYYPKKFTVAADDRMYHNPLNQIGSLKAYQISDYQRMFSKKQKIRKAKSEPFILSEPKTICDIDPEFYKIIEGRPIRQFIDVKIYMRNIRDITLFRANAAYLKDQVIAINTSISDELQVFNEIDKFYHNIQSEFSKFLKESYENAHNLQKLAEKKSVEVDNVIDQLNSYSFSYVKLRNEVDNFMAIFEFLSKYGSFLYSLSPYWWKEKNYHNFEERRNVAAISRCTNVESPSAGSIDMYRHSVSIIRGKHPKIYFKKPLQLVRIFEDIGRQCLNYLQIQCHNSNILRSIVKNNNKFKGKVNSEIEEAEYLFSLFRKQILQMEEKSEEYKNKFNKILVNNFQYLFASFDSIKLFTCVQYVHSNIFDEPEDPKDSIKALIYDIESMYIDLASKLDDLHQNVVKKATEEVFSEDILRIKRAHKAQRDLRECDLLEKSLFASFEPSRRKK